MKRCPKCNCGAEFTNKVEYYAANTGAFAAGLVVAAPIAFINKNAGTHVGKEVFDNLKKNVHKHYKCTNSNCNHEWDE